LASFGQVDGSHFSVLATFVSPCLMFSISLSKKNLLISALSCAVQSHGRCTADHRRHPDFRLQAKYLGYGLNLIEHHFLRPARIRQEALLGFV
jgi:hypothetical protein